MLSAQEYFLPSLKLQPSRFLLGYTVLTTPQTCSIYITNHQVTVNKAEKVKCVNS